VFSWQHHFRSSSHASATSANPTSAALYIACHRRLSLLTVFNMSKRPTDHLEPAAKKRGNDRQLTKDDPSDEDEVRTLLFSQHYGAASYAR